MEIENSININNELNNNLKNEKNNFLDTMLGKAINTGIDMGLRYLLPDLIENEIIDIKNAIFQNGLKDGINTAIESVKNFGKSAFGIISGKFENISQVEKAIGNGGILETISTSLDYGIDKIREKGLINNTIKNVLKNGKDMMLDNVSNNIKNEIKDQVENIDKLNSYIENWNMYFDNKDFSGMEREYKKIKTKLNEVMPLQETINKANTLSNLHELIKNNNKDFNLSEEEFKLVKMLK